MGDLRDQIPGIFGNAPAAGGVKIITLGAATSPAICIGSGTPTVVAPKGSLFLATDGSSSSTRLYVASDSAGTWVAVTTAS